MTAGVNVTNGTPTTYGSMATPSTVPIAAHKKARSADDAVTRYFRRPSCLCSN